MSPKLRGYYRMADANYNRAKEALRVAEDVARFILDDRALALAFKRLRHRLGSVLARTPALYRKCLEARDSRRDIGRASRIEDRPRRGWRDLMTANLKRAQEASRALEEMARVLAASRVRTLERIRYELYDLEKRSFRKF